MAKGEGKFEAVATEQKAENSAESLSKIILERVKELGPEMEKWYADFHENPELGGEERETSQKVVNFLRGIGVEIVGEKIGLGTKSKETGKFSEGTGVVAIIRGREDGPTIALRADMDALPMQEDKSHSPCSKKDNLMHGCGHDTHIAALMGAAQILKDFSKEGKLEGDVVLIFQPNEEGSRNRESGAVQIIRFLEESGLREKIKAFLGLHVFGEMEKGKIKLNKQIEMASCGGLDIILKGPGGHVTKIYEQPDLEFITSKISLELKNKFRPLYKKEKKALVSSPRPNYLNESYNVLPTEVSSSWSIRIADPLYRKISNEIVSGIKSTVNKIVQEELENVGATEGVSVEIKRIPGSPPVIHRSQELVRVAEQSAEKAIKDYKGNEDEMLLTGEDFSFYLEKFRGKTIPGVYVFVGGANPKKGFPKTSLHSPDFKIDPEAIKDLAALHAVFAVKAVEYFKGKEPLKQ